MPVLPLFPLNLVVYPGEDLNLHIFEPRYRQLIGECLETGSRFGIPTFLDSTLPGFGCEMEIKELVRQYEDGRMDVRTHGLCVFRLLEFTNPLPDKLYAGGAVQRWPEPGEQLPVMPELVELVQRLYSLLEMPLKASPDYAQPYSYQIAHLIGLPLQGEYEVLTILSESERQVFLLEHLLRALPLLEEMERSRSRVRMNGHFREFGPLDY